MEKYQVSPNIIPVDSINPIMESKSKSKSTSKKLSEMFPRYPPSRLTSPSTFEPPDDNDPIVWIHLPNLRPKTMAEQVVEKILDCQNQKKTQLNFPYIISKTIIKHLTKKGYKVTTYPDEGNTIIDWDNTKEII